jgi:2-methylfumaryl-CoA hydratase
MSKSVPKAGGESRSKTNPGNFFEDFKVGQVIRHATPRTITTGDVALYTGLYASRFAINCSDAFARTIGLPRAPVDDMLVFHMVFGKTVPDISLNAIANLGYAGCRFLKPVYPGDTLEAQSEIVGLKENSNRKTGIVYVHTKGMTEAGETMLEYFRWVMVNKRDPAAATPEPVEPTLPKAVEAKDLGAALPEINARAYDTALAGSPHRWGDYRAGDRINHVDGFTIEESDHQIITRLTQNTAKVHFNLHTERKGRFGKRIVYGGHVISFARAISFNGLANAIHVAAINGGRHVAPSFAGDTLYAWSEILATAELPGRKDVGACRVRTVAAKDRPCHDYPGRKADGEYEEGVVLDLDYWVLMPR